MVESDGLGTHLGQELGNWRGMLRWITHRMARLQPQQRARGEVTRGTNGVSSSLVTRGTNTQVHKRWFMLHWLIGEATGRCLIPCIYLYICIDMYMYVYIHVYM